MTVTNRLDNELSILLILGRIYLRQYNIWFSKLDTIMQSLPQTSCDKLQSLDIPSLETIKDSYNLGETISKNYGKKVRES